VTGKLTVSQGQANYLGHSPFMSLLAHQISGYLISLYCPRTKKTNPDLAQLRSSTSYSHWTNSVRTRTSINCICHGNNAKRQQFANLGGAAVKQHCAHKNIFIKRMLIKIRLIDFRIIDTFASKANVRILYTVSFIVSLGTNLFQENLFDNKINPKQGTRDRAASSHQESAKNCSMRAGICNMM
jgi:hypothetical protein